MTYETRDNTGSLWRNDRKEKDTHPDHTGSARINGTDMWISAWIRETNGKKYFSLAFKPKDGTAARPDDKAAEFVKKATDAFPGAKFAGLDDDVPFAPEFR